MSIFFEQKQPQPDNSPNYKKAKCGGLFYCMVGAALSVIPMIQILAPEAIQTETEYKPTVVMTDAELYQEYLEVNAEIDATLAEIEARRMAEWSKKYEAVFGK